MTTDEKRKRLEEQGYQFHSVDYFPSRPPQVTVRAGDWWLTFYYEPAVGTVQAEYEILEYLVDKAWEHYQHQQHIDRIALIIETAKSTRVLETHTGVLMVLGEIANALEDSD